MYLNRLYFVLLISLCFCISKAQTIRFNKQYNFGFSTGGYFSTNVISKGNDYLVCGLGVNPAQNQNYCLGVICTDSMGTQKWQMHRNAPGNLKFSNNSSASSFQKLKDGNVLFCGEVDYAYAYSKSCLVKLSKFNGDTIWTKQYSQVGDTSNLFCTSQLTDSSFISIGHKYWFDGVNLKYHRPFILKTDKNGNYKWHKYLSNLTASIAFWYNRLLNINDKDFVVVGSNSDRRGFMIKFDTLGNLNLNKNYTVNTYSLNYISDIINSNDGNYLMCGSAITYHTFNFSQVKTKPCLIKINKATGNLVMSKLYGKEIDVHSFYTLHQSSTGSIYAMGEELFLPTNFKAALYKFNSNLDSLFTRYYESPGGGQYSCSDMLSISDGGFAFPMQMYPFTNQQQFNLMKTDSMGCDSVNGCSYSTVSIKKNLYNDKIKAYPNPVDNVLCIESDVTDLKLEMVNTLGQLVKDFDVTYSDGKILIKTTNLNNGFYSLNLIDATKVYAPLKFLIIH